MTSEKEPPVPAVPPVPPPPCASARGLFDTAMGPLQCQLRAGEYNIFKWAPMFEADFVQVSKQGGALDVHNQVQLVRAAIVATSPSLQVPNVLLLARPLTPATDPRAPHKPLGNNSAAAKSPGARFELTRLLPLCFVKISIHSLERQQLRFKLATGRTFYLQLLPPPSEGAAPSTDFQAWVKVVHLLRPPADPAGEEVGQAQELAAAGLSLLHTPLPLSVEAPPEKEEEEAEEEEEEEERREGGKDEEEEEEGEEEEEEEEEQEEEEEEEEEEEGPALPLMGAPAGDAVSESAWEEPPPPPSPTEETQMQRAKERAPPSRKHHPRSKSGKSRRSHSSKRASSRSHGRISSLFRTSFSGAGLRSRKAANKSQDRHH
ncbi:Golgi-associated RAB2 interactor protein 3-like isoform X2 [Anolis carolinensis]|uniref:Golgi-associated RAB2 interactor protein 3-like isoform X2 n=1 Tax=Anolis carolinensis TaxID=28377 RepID=UPI002F2B39BF